MNERDRTETSLPHQWRDQLGGIWLQHAPRSNRKTGDNWSVVGPAFIAFLWVLGHKADADGVNRRPPGSPWLAAAARTSRDSTRRFYNAAEKLGVIRLVLSPGGRYVTGYTLIAAPLYALDWDACRSVLMADTRSEKQREKRAEEHRRQELAAAREEMATRRTAAESARADSAGRIVRVESARADSLAPTTHGTGDLTSPSLHVRTPSEPTESARADSRPDLPEQRESARADSGSPHVPQASPHVRGLPGTTRAYQDVAEVVTQGADPRAQGRSDEEITNAYVRGGVSVLTDDERRRLPGIINRQRRRMGLGPAMGR